MLNSKIRHPRMSFRRNCASIARPFAPKSNVWANSSAQNRSSIVGTAADKLISMGNDEKGTLRFVHDYLESRLALLKTIEVCIWFFSRLRSFVKWSAC